jgi:pimeloyl-ACP methyl ester carboxylesterase
MLADLLEGAALAAGEGLDRIFSHAAFRSRRASRRARTEATPTFLERYVQAAEHYDACARAGSLFPAPPSISPRAVRVRDLPGGSVADLAWPTGWSAPHARYVELTSQHPANDTCSARWWRHDTPAPAVICLNGWGGGRFLWEEHSFRARMLWRAGLDVLFFVLPLHATRRNGLFQGMPPFPSPNPFVTNDGIGQAVIDIRALVAWLRRQGTPAVGVAGMSLGGFVSGLLATVEPTLDFVAPMIPVASMADMIWDSGAGSEAHTRAVAAGLTREILAKALAATSTLHRTPLVPKSRVLCIAGERDLVVPRHHAERLREHLSAHELVFFPGSHILQTGKDAAWGTLITFLADLGISGVAAPAAERAS